jgi:acyl dehydratase
MIYDMKDTFGRYFEDYIKGDIYKHWPGKTITEGDHNLFTSLIMNHNPLHIDKKYCEGTQHKQILVVGTLVFSLVAGMSVSEISGKAISNLDYENITHDGPVFIGDTIYAETEILETHESRSKSDRGIIYVETKAFNQNGEKVLTFRRHALIMRKG